MPSVPSNTKTVGRSCWSIDYWLRNCVGFRVWDATGPIGFVETVLMSEDDEPHSLIVRVGTVFSVLLTFPADAVEGVDPATKRVFVGSPVPTARREGRQLRIPALA